MPLDRLTNSLFDTFAGLHTYCNYIAQKAWHNASISFQHGRFSLQIVCMILLLDIKFLVVLLLCRILFLLQVKDERPTRAEIIINWYKRESYWGKTECMAAQPLMPALAMPRAHLLQPPGLYLCVLCLVFLASWEPEVPCIGSQA